MKISLFIRYRFHFISDWGSVCNTSFSLHIGLPSCLHENASLYTALVSLYTSCIHCLFLEGGRGDGGNLIGLRYGDVPLFRGTFF